MPSTPSHAGAEHPRLSVPDVLERWGLLIFLAALIVFFSVHPTIGEVFRSGPNVQNILANQSVTAIVALAMVVPLVAGYFDLSVAAVAGLANVVVAAVIGTHGHPIWVGIAAGLAIGVTAGAVNGFLVAGLRLNGFVVTLGTFTLIGGLVQWYTQGQTISGVPASFADWGSEKWLGVPRPLWLLLGVTVLVWYVLMQTPFGRRLEGIGSNEGAARLVGIRVDWSVFLSFLGSGALAAVAGVLLTSRAGVADPTAGPAYLFPALAAVFIGTTTIRPGRYNVWGTIAGVFLVAVAVTGLTLLGADTWVTPVFNGAALVLAVAISTLMGRRRDKLARELSSRPPAEAAEEPVPESSALRA